MEILTVVLLWAFGLAVVLGFFATKTNFCTMGAVSDVVNIGDTGRMRSWVFAIGLAILGVMGLSLLGLTDTSLIANNDTANPPYLTANFAWPRHILGGLIFGIGMTLGSGCGNKTLVRLGGGNIKSIFVFFAMGVTTYLMIFTNFSYTAFLSWMEPAFIDLSLNDIENQGLGTVIAHFIGTDIESTTTIVAVLLGGLLILWAFLSNDFRDSLDNILGGFIVALVVVTAWWVTTGELGQTLLEEAEMMDEQPFALGAQSFTFSQPSGHFLRWVETGFSSSLYTFALMAAFGVVVGSFLYSILARKFRFEWFANWKDFVVHIIGGLLMGIGGVLAMGCTIGQGVTGASTLAMGSFLTFFAIVLGSALTMKIQFYKMVYEEEASFGKALVAGLADMKLLPNSFRKLDKV
ncbi:YeeE/YedE family protein [Cocleimonas sp. KMM 6892]|uniref:YeeE/YedE family protein n=1 Tax=unclassified Cocleimonas TaxID=2639732 RepID=UPI002DBD706F|nr:MULTISPECIES: YeeE/YedE family protein [unclassified Cocleimonas]MEB8434183.1 YeeE/YedE family protein [Cocleimonas sp. KMM 6892]MEC4716957.1 YeeE/YedE family protein [Cocleimonas sp. KMM 6895]MEC4746455.1 YeeE/YedE family protein [Cocleimonas sp. KMM 6896]